jgi:hypothetical protein
MTNAIFIRTIKKTTHILIKGTKWGSALKVYDDKIRQLKATTVLPTSVSRTHSDCVANTVTYPVPAVRAQAELHAPCKDKMSVL